MSVTREQPASTTNVKKMEEGVMEGALFVQ